jgi:hypothetical protein
MPGHNLEILSPWPASSEADMKSVLLSGGFGNWKEFQETVGTSFEMRISRHVATHNLSTFYLVLLSHLVTSMAV